MPIPLICAMMIVLGFFFAVMFCMYLDGCRNRDSISWLFGLGIPLCLLSLWIYSSCQYDWKIKEQSFHEIKNVELESGSSQLFTYDGKIFNATEKFGRVVDPAKIMVKRTLYEDTYLGIMYFDPKVENPGIFTLVERCNEEYDGGCN